MTLSSRHRLQNLIPGVRRSSTLALGHGGSLQYYYCFKSGWEGNNFVSFKPPRPETEPRTLAWKAAVRTWTTLSMILGVAASFNIGNLWQNHSKFGGVFFAPSFETRSNVWYLDHFTHEIYVCYLPHFNLDIIVCLKIEMGVCYFFLRHRIHDHHFLPFSF